MTWRRGNFYHRYFANATSQACYIAYRLSLRGLRRRLLVSAVDAVAEVVRLPP